MSEDRNAFVKQYVENHVKNWTSEAALRGIEYKDHEHSTTRLLATVIAQSLWDTFHGEEDVSWI